MPYRVRMSPVDTAWLRMDSPGNLMMIVGIDVLASVERTNGQLQLALERWQSTTGGVVFSGPWGWVDPHASRFENDPAKESFPEEWEQPNAPGVGGLGRTIASFLEGLDGVQREK